MRIRDVGSADVGEQGFGSDEDERKGSKGGEGRWLRDENDMVDAGEDVPQLAGDRDWRSPGTWTPTDGLCSPSVRTHRYPPSIVLHVRTLCFDDPCLLLMFENTARLPQTPRAPAASTASYLIA